MNYELDGTMGNSRDFKPIMQAVLTIIAIYCLAFTLPLIVVGLFTGPHLLAGAAVHFIVGTLALLARIRLSRTV